MLKTKRQQVIATLKVLLFSLSVIEGLGAQVMPKLYIKSSPSPDVTLTPFSPSLYPVFNEVFDRFDRGIAALAPASFVVSNGSGKAIIGIGVKWRLVDSAGRESTYDEGTHSFLVMSQRPLAPAHGRLLAAPRTFVSEDLLLHPEKGVVAVLPGDAFIARFSAAVTIHAEVDSIVFQDGEVVGPDDLGLVKSIRDRRDAAAEIVKQVESAQAEGKDASEALRTVATRPPFGDPGVARFERKLASELLDTRQFDSRLQYLKGIPAPPLFYRKDTGPIWR
jgi:hypothetical protein